MHLIPELNAARRDFAAAVPRPLPYEGMAVYFLALIGFLVFYGADHLRAQLKASAAKDEDRSAFMFHVGGFAAYVWLMAYLLVHGLEAGSASTALYAVAIASHFLAVDHALREEHGDAYHRVGRYVLAGMCILGWVTSLLVDLPDHAIALLTSFVSGAIVMNSAIMELPPEKDGRFVPFMAGGALYGLLLLPLG